MKNVLTLILVVFCQVLVAQTPNDLFGKGNIAYKDGNYQEAIDLYAKIEDQNLASVDLYFNMANAYYKLNKVGPSIYYYEKALQLDPQNEDVRTNLVFAKRLALDTIEELPKTLFQKINKNYLQVLSYNQWSYLVIGFSFFGCLFFLMYYLVKRSGTKRLYFILSATCFFLFISSFFITYNQYQLAINKRPAIIFAEKTEIRSAPTLNAEEIFEIYEGTKVLVVDAIDDWKKITLADGKEGWIVADHLKEL